MKALSSALSLFFAAVIIKPTAGILCDTDCAACWKMGSSTVDIKIGCQFGNCPFSCPGGYENIHCATSRRCLWVDVSIDDFFSWTNEHSRIGARMTVVNLARAIAEWTIVKMGGKVVKYRIQVRSVQVDYLPRVVAKTCDCILNLRRSLTWLDPFTLCWPA